MEKKLSSELGQRQFFTFLYCSWDRLISVFSQIRVAVHVLVTLDSQTNTLRSFYGLRTANAPAHIHVQTFYRYHTNTYDIR